MAKNSKQLLRDRAWVTLLLLLVLGFGLAIVGMARAGLIHGADYRQKAEAEQIADTKINSQRGTIYDKNGNVLAVSADAYKVVLNPALIHEEEEIDVKDLSNKLAEILEADPNEIYQKATKTYTDKDSGKTKYSQYTVIGNKVDNDTKSKIEALIKDNKKLKDKITFEEDVKRYYPYDNFASTVLGFAGSSGGSAGLEFYYNDTLSGTPGRSIGAQDAHQRTISSDYGSTYAAQQGTNLQLTIDEVIQYYLDSALSSAVEKHQARYGYGIVMDVKTGAILAMSTQPDFNCNEPYTVTDEKKAKEIASTADTKEKQKLESDALNAQWRNRTVTDSYEPGSVFKCVTAAAGIEEGVVTPNEMFTCTGSYSVRGQIYHCSNNAGHGRETFTRSLENSCNPIYIEVAQRIGAKTFSKYFDAFGMSEKTGIDLPSESTPKADVTYHSVDKMGPVQLASSSFGQTFQVSPIQMCSAINAIANDGKLMQPYIVDKYLDKSGNAVHVTKPVQKRQVVSKQTANTVADMMEHVVMTGTAKNAYVPGYRVAGKTGTSEKLTKSGKLYIGSFCGFAPVDDPQVTCLIIIDEPKGDYTGGKTAAPVAAEVLRNTLRYLNVEPEYNEKEAEGMDIRTPDEIGVEKNAAAAELKEEGFTVLVKGSGKKVIAQNPKAGKLVPPHGVVVLYTDTESQNERVKVPNLTGMSFAQAKAAANAVGLNVESTGQNAVGSSYSQNISAGTEVSLGSVITVSYVTHDDEMDVEDTGGAD